MITCLTGQHREMLDQVAEVFDLAADHDLRVMRERQTLGHITSAVLKGLGSILEAVKPDLAFVHGDTTTTLGAALAAFYHRIPVAHVEAGLRTDNAYDPYPEEMNRRLVDGLSTLFYAPTSRARAALVGEGAPSKHVLVTGNTVIDALPAAGRGPKPAMEPHVAAALEEAGPKVLVTAHRRESWGAPMKKVARAISDICTRLPDVTFIFPLHLNPVVRSIFRATLGTARQVVFTEPLPYGEFVHLLKAMDIVMTDSGGLQEEALSFGKPVLVMRETTERPEGVATGSARLVGTDPATIVEQTVRLLTDADHYRTMASAGNPYGDGHAARRIADHLEYHFGLRLAPPEEFTPLLS